MSNELKNTARTQLSMTRGMTEKLLSEFSLREHWLHRAGGVGNHALWIVCHLALADNFMMSQLRPESVLPREDLEALYWFGTEPTAEDGPNVSVDDAMEYLKNRRANLMRVLDEFTEAEWNQAWPEGHRFAERFPNMGHIFTFNAIHESIHYGQLTVVHRSLGNTPMFKPQPAETS